MIGRNDRAILKSLGVEHKPKKSKPKLPPLPDEQRYLFCPACKVLTVHVLLVFVWVLGCVATAGDAITLNYWQQFLFLFTILRGRRTKFLNLSILPKAEVIFIRRD